MGRTMGLMGRRRPRKAGWVPRARRQFWAARVILTLSFFLIQLVVHTAGADCSCCALQQQFNTSPTIMNPDCTGAHFTEANKEVAPLTSLL